MKHTTVCGKSADRPIGGPCQRKPRPRTVIETQPVLSPPTAAAHWLFRLSCRDEAEIGIDPARAQARLVRIPKQAALTPRFIGPEPFRSTSITRLSSCKPETSPRWNLIGRAGHKLTSRWSRWSGPFAVSSGRAEFGGGGFGSVSYVSVYGDILPGPTAVTSSVRAARRWPELRSSPKEGFTYCLKFSNREHRLSGDWKSQLSLKTNGYIKTQLRCWPPVCFFSIINTGMHIVTLCNWPASHLVNWTVIFDSE